MSVREGECCVLLGRNGSGKSTLVRLVLGLEPVSSGSVRTFEREVSVKGGRGRTCAVLDTSVHWERLSGWDNGFFTARSYGLSRREAETRLEGLFARADLWPFRGDPVGTYSFGMRKKLSLIQALAPDPELLVMDEPTAGLDAQFRAEMGKILKERRGRGRTTLCASNDPDWAQLVASRAVFMVEGRNVAQGTVNELLDEAVPTQEAVIELESALEIEPPDFTRTFSLHGRSITALIDRDPFLVPRLMTYLVDHGGIVRSVEVRRSSLRDAFLLRTGRSLEE
jgi:ABC-type multidrug transport system ATPase subunit